MSDEKPKEDYDLFQDNIVERLHDADFFIKCMMANYAVLADQWSCKITQLQRRFREAHNFWLEDIGRAKRENMPEGTIQLDHFKHASFIAFWLRRMLPIASASARPFDGERRVVKERVNEFFCYGNEITALLIGFAICLFYESSKIVETEDGKVIPFHKDRLQYLQGRVFPPELLHDFAVVLKHKNVSPHSLYLMYKALFTDLRRTSAKASTPGD